MDIPSRSSPRVIDIHFTNFWYDYIYIYDAGQHVLPHFPHHLFFSSPSLEKKDEGSFHDDGRFIYKAAGAEICRLEEDMLLLCNTFKLSSAWRIVRTSERITALAASSLFSRPLTLAYCPSIVMHDPRVMDINPSCFSSSKFPSFYFSSCFVF